MDQLMNVTATTCDCCEDVTYHIPFSINDLTITEGLVTAHLTEDEMLDLYFQLKEFKTGIATAITED